MKQTQPPWKPHPPPNPEWPEYVQRMYLKGRERIDVLRKQVDEDGTVPLPFRCYGCDEMRTDYAMKTGDGVPLCQKCLNGPLRTITEEKILS